MLEMFTTDLETNKTIKTKQYQKGNWINLVAPSEEEIKTVLGKRNYVILIISLILIIIGYILMSGKGSTPAAYNPDIFSGLRIKVAPVVCLTGYLINIFGILYRPRRS